jgi:hypothetical protein
VYAEANAAGEFYGRYRGVSNGEWELAIASTDLTYAKDTWQVWGAGRVMYQALTAGIDAGLTGK